MQYSKNKIKSKDKEYKIEEEKLNPINMLIPFLDQIETILLVLKVFQAAESKRTIIRKLNVVSSNVEYGHIMLLLNVTKEILQSVSSIFINISNFYYKTLDSLDFKL